MGYKKERQEVKRYGQSFTQRDAEVLGTIFDMVARGGDLSVLKESASFRKLYAQVVRLRVRVREDSKKG